MCIDKKMIFSFYLITLKELRESPSVFLFHQTSNGIQHIPYIEEFAVKGIIINRLNYLIISFDDL